MFFQFCGTMVQKCIALLMTLLMNLGAAVSAVIQPISLPTLAQSASTYTVGNLTVQLIWETAATRSPTKESPSSAKPMLP